MGGDLHQNIVAFAPLSPGREAVMLGHIQVGELSPTHDPRSQFQTCYRLDLPGLSSRAWQPARDLAEARRLTLRRINDWLNAADLRPNGRI